MPPLCHRRSRVVNNDLTPLLCLYLLKLVTDTFIPLSIAAYNWSTNHIILFTSLSTHMWCFMFCLRTDVQPTRLACVCVHLALLGACGSIYVNLLCCFLEKCGHLINITFNEQLFYFRRLRWLSYASSIVRSSSTSVFGYFLSRDTK